MYVPCKVLVRYRCACLILSKQEKEEKAGKKGQWNWSRDKDLDSGRRVDKNALHMVVKIQFLFTHNGTEAKLGRNSFFY